MSASTVSDILPATLPELDVSGDNWAIFELRFWTVVQGKGLWGHYDGTSPRPKLPAPVVAQATTSPSQAASTAAGVSLPASTPSPSGVVVTPEMVDVWERNENIARSLLIQ
jgi:hypothetical protein